MSDEKFKLPQSSYEELSKVIKAYGHFSEPKPLDEISKFIGLHRTIISGNAGFLVGVGILEPGAKKVPTANGRKLAHALEHNMPDEIRTWWRQIVSGNDFLTRLLAAIRIRSGMDQQTLEAHIAYSAGQPKKPQFMTGARTVISFLARLSNRLGVSLVGASGISQKLDKFRSGNHLPKKTVEAAKYLGQVRNAADHGVDVDPDVGAVWHIQRATGVQYVFVACSFIASALEREAGGQFLI